MKVRYSLDDCATMSEVPARPAPSADDQTVRYVACIPFPPKRAATMLLAVRYVADGVVHWDNNAGANYVMPVGTALKPISTESTKKAASRKSILARKDHSVVATELIY